MGLLQAAGDFAAVGLTAETARGLGPVHDRALAERRHAHHQEHAVLGLLSAEENLCRPHG